MKMTSTDPENRKSHLWLSSVKRRCGGRPPPSQGRLPRMGRLGRQGMEN